MKRRLALVVAFVLLAAGPSTRASAQVTAAGLDHPDLLDARDRFKPDPGDVVGAGTASYADVFFGNETSGFAFWGGARGRVSGSDIALTWFLSTIPMSTLPRPKTIPIAGSAGRTSLTPTER